MNHSFCVKRSVQESLVLTVLRFGFDNSLGNMSVPCSLMGVKTCANLSVQESKSLDHRIAR